MLSFLSHFIMRLSSRKFLLTVVGIVVFYIQQEWGALAGTIATYIGFEGTADIAGRWKKGSDEHEVDLRFDTKDLKQPSMVDDFPNLNADDSPRDISAGNDIPMN